MKLCIVSRYTIQYGRCHRFTATVSDWKHMDTSEVRHPGERIKAEVFPAKMSVTKAAELIGVGRPALSNLLNGKVSSLPIWRLASRRHSDSPGKICSKCRLSTTPSKLNRRASRRTRKRMSPVPGNQSQRHRELGFVQHRRSQQVRGIPEDLGPFDRERTHGSRLPGNDDSQRAGWDGRIVANEGTAWVPAGHSGWEFGTNEDPKTKADKDYKKRSCN